MPVDTRHVADRRKLQFRSYDEIFQEAERLVQAPRLRQLGNWNLGQILAHLTKGMVISLDGPVPPVPIVYRLVGKLIKNRALAKPFPGGVKLPKKAAVVLVPEPDVSAQDALASLGKAIHRLKTETQRTPHAFFGKLSNAQWDMLHFRHADLHLSFVEPLDGME